MATWASYLGLGRKTAEEPAPAPAPNVSQPEDLSEKFALKPFDPSSSYGGKAAEDAIVEPISKAMDSAQSAFTKGSRRTQSDAAPTSQPATVVAPRRTQSNASRVARMFGYGAPVPDEPKSEDQASTPQKNPGLEKSTDPTKITAQLQTISRSQESKIVPPTALRSTVKVATQPSILNIVDEAVEQAERVMLEYERQSQKIRIERDAMEAERAEMFQAQEKMRKDLERISQEEEEIFEYYKIMGIEEPRPRWKINDEFPKEKAEVPLDTSNEPESVLERRRATQRELDLEIKREEAKKLEYQRLVIDEEDKLDSESEYEDEYIDDIPGSPREEEAGQVSVKNNDDAELLRYEEEIEAERRRYEEAEFDREAERMEAERIAQAQKRIVENERRRREQLEFEEMEKERLAVMARELEEQSMLEAAERFEAQKLESQRLETERRAAEERERKKRLDAELEETFRKQALEREAREREAILMRENEEREALEREAREREAIFMRENEEREALERERQRLEAERIAEEERFEEERRFSLQRRLAAEAKAELERQDALARANDAAAEAEFERSEEIRKAEAKMRNAFAAMAAEKGSVPITVPTLLTPGFPPAGRRSLIDSGNFGVGGAGSSSPNFDPEPPRTPPRPRPSIKGGLPTGPKGGGKLPARRKPSVDQTAPALPRRAEIPKQPTPPDEAGLVPTKQNTLGPRPSIKGGLPSGPRGGGSLPPRRNLSVDQASREVPRGIGLPGGPRGGGLPINRKPLLT